MDWTPLSLHHKVPIEDTLKKYPIRLCDYTFTNLWMWNDLRHYQIAFINDFLCIKFFDQGTQKYLYPIGEGQRKEIIQLLAADSSTPFYMRAIPENAAEELSSLPWQLAPEFEHFDYIYSYKDLLELSGNRYQSKRNHVHQFESNYPFDYREITAELIPQLIEMENQWIAEHPSPSENLMHEHQGALRVLNDLTKLNVIGGALLVENRVAAYTIAEYMSCQMVVVHIEKALQSYKGAYPTINQQLLKHLCQVKFVNREEDLGLINLAKVKRSYHPVFLEKSFCLC